MKKTMKYIIAILIAAIGVYNLINWFGQGSAMPLYFAIEAFCLCGIFKFLERNFKNYYSHIIRG